MFHDRMVSHPTSAEIKSGAFAVLGRMQENKYHISWWGWIQRAAVALLIPMAITILVLLMKEGYPCLFYGDYYGIKGEKSPHTRIIDILLDARRKYAYGDQIEYFDHPSTIGFIRTGDEEHNGSGLVFLMSNDEAGSKIMSLGEKHKGEVWHEITGSISEEITLDEEGNGEFSVESRNLAVWVKKD